MPREEILASEDTPIGRLVLRRRPVQGDPGRDVTEVLLADEFLMSSFNTDSERALSDLALDLHPGTTLNVLIGGLGLGYTAHQVLQSDRTAMVEVVELLPQVIDWLTTGLIPLADALNAEPRLGVTRGDVYARLLGEPGETHDLILIDVDHSPESRLGEADATFYSPEGLRKAKRHLSPGGILGVWSCSANDAFHKALDEVFSEVRVETVKFENEFIDERETNWLFFARRTEE